MIWEVADFFWQDSHMEEFLSVVNVNSEPGIASVLNKDAVNVSDGMEGSDPGCTVCEMAVVWAPNQLRANWTREHIDAYLNQVDLFT